MILIKELSGGYINVDYIASMLTYNDTCWCKLINQDTFQISSETYNKLVEKYGKV